MNYQKNGCVNVKFWITIFKQSEVINNILMKLYGNLSLHNVKDLQLINDEILDHRCIPKDNQD